LQKPRALLNIANLPSLCLQTGEKLEKILIQKGRKKRGRGERRKEAENPSTLRLIQTEMTCMPFVALEMEPPAASSVSLDSLISNRAPPSPGPLYAH